MTRTITRLEQLVEDSRKLSKRTKSAYRAAVLRFVLYAGPTPAGWSPAAAEAWVQQLAAEGLAPQSINHSLAGLRWASARRAAMDGATDFASAIELFKVEKKVRPNRALNAAEARRLLATCATDSWSDLRDRAMLLLGLRAGLRRFEIAAARWDQLRVSELTLTGKGGKEERVQLDGVTRAALMRWREVSGVDVRGEGGMFYRRYATLSGKPQPLTPDGVYHILKGRAAQAGIKRFSPHCLRHTCVSLLLAAGVPPWRVQLAARHRGQLRGELMGSTTAGYAHDQEGAVGEALWMLGEEKTEEKTDE